MSKRTIEKRSLTVDMLLFGATVATAYLMNWSAMDLVWGLWISSFTVGYSFILLTVLKMLVTCDTSALSSGNKTSINAPAPEPECTVLSFLCTIPSAAFFLGFFTFHFGMFHLAHGSILNDFFQLVDPARFGLKGKAPADPVFIIELIRTAIVEYWPFIALSALSRTREYRAAFFGRPDAAAMFMPYVNVIRMHVMIFVFAFMNKLGLDRVALYPLLIMYFFPMGELLDVFSKRKKDADG
jgi:hypothetical protein